MVLVGLLGREEMVLLEGPVPPVLIDVSKNVLLLLGRQFFLKVFDILDVLNLLQLLLFLALLFPLATAQLHYCFLLEVEGDSWDFRRRGAFLLDRRCSHFLFFGLLVVDAVHLLNQLLLAEVDEEVEGEGTPLADFDDVNSGTHDS